MAITRKALPSLSFEFFPPHTPEGSLRLWRSVERLAPLAPQYVSVTYGAGGTTRDRTNVAIQTIIDRARLNVAGHLTCVGATREETLEVARGYARMGVRRIVALRGDPQKGEASFVPHPQGFRSAAELVAGLRSVGDFEIAVGAYPEVHPEAVSAAADIDNLTRKIDAGASTAITQFFFDNDKFEAYVEKVRAAGLDIPVVPGIVPVHNFTQVAGFAKRAGASVPDWLARRFEGLEDDAPTRQLVAAAVAAEQVLDLVDRGVTDFHFYTMNRADLVYAICHLLGMRPAKAPAPVEAAA